MYIGTCAAIAYIKEAKFVADALQEKWPADLRGLINNVRSLKSGPLEFTTEQSTARGFTTTISFNVPLGLTDIIVLE